MNIKYKIQKDLFDLLLVMITPSDLDISVMWEVLKEIHSEP